MSSPQIHVSNFIVNNAYSGQTKSLHSLKPQSYDKKIKYKFYNPLI